MNPSHERRTMVTQLETDVVIVGAGPTGLMMANCLAKLGVPATVIDSKSGPTRESRALVLQARTMEIYDQLGVIDRALAESEIASSIVPGYEKKRFTAVNLTALATGTTPFPHAYVLEQSRNESLLVDNLRRLGTEVRWNHGIDSLEPDGERLIVRAGDVTIRARYCVAADGSSSAVRGMTGIPFEGKTNEHTFYVLDATGVTGLVLDAINLRFGARDFLLTFPMGAPDHERLLGVVRDADEAADERLVARILGQTFGVGFAKSLWLSTYRVHHRVAARFAAGRVFLAGDAAHVHSPVGAQGMNTGLQDAHNLACKIADVLAGRAPEDYLRRYEAERRPVALRLVSTTDTLFGVITSDRRFARFVRRRVIPTFAPFGPRLLPRLVGSARIFEYLSQTRIHYWMNDGAKRRAHGRRGAVVGRRLPFNGDNFDSLRAMQWQVHGYGDADVSAVRPMGLPTHVFGEIRNRRLRPGMLYLVRPDGFVAAMAGPDSAAAVFASALPSRL
jgi:2-polyprenyl-6-methoxyphenol hydroxylase-like FAD-dependent oxidoreductase